MSGTPLSNGKMHLHSSVKRKLAEEKGYVFDKRLRYNVRQNESNCRFRDIVVRKEEGFTHVLLSSQTTDNNALTPEVRSRDARLSPRCRVCPACVGASMPCSSVWGNVQQMRKGH